MLPYCISFIVEFYSITYCNVVMQVFDDLNWPLQNAFSVYFLFLCLLINLETKVYADMCHVNHCTTCWDVK